MSLIKEIHRQSPAVRFSMFALSAAITVSVTVFFLFSSIQRDLYFVTHPDAEEQRAYIEQRAEDRPQILAAITSVAGSLVAEIGSLIGWDRDAGFDRGGREGSIQGGVHLLPQSE